MRPFTFAFPTPLGPVFYRGLWRAPWVLDLSLAHMASCGLNVEPAKCTGRLPMSSLTSRGIGAFGTGCDLEFNRWLQPADMIALAMDGIIALLNTVLKT